MPCTFLFPSRARAAAWRIRPPRHHRCLEPPRRRWTPSPGSLRPRPSCGLPTETPRSGAAVFLPDRASSSARSRSPPPPPRSPSSSPLHRQKALPEVRSKVRKATPFLNHVPYDVSCLARSPAMRRSPWPPRCLLRRLVRRCKWLGESLLCSSSFWYLPRRVWWSGGHLWPSSGEPPPRRPPEPPHIGRSPPTSPTRDQGRPIGADGPV
jgi:hypothetical protein